MSGLLLALGLAASTPRLIYKPDPARLADVATVEVLMPSHHPCFGVTRVSVLLSSAKSDRNRIYALSAAVADSLAPAHITGADAGQAALKMVNVRDGDVACTEYQCPTGSAAVFALDDAQRAAARTGALAVKVHTNAGSSCDVSAAIDGAVFGVLDAWADKLPGPPGR